MTRVVQPRDFGGPTSSRLIEVDIPEPGEGEVLVAVRAIGVNPIDWYHYDGVHSDDPEDLLTFGYEVAGVVEAVGPGVTGFAVGDEVVVSEIPGNGYAEHVRGARVRAAAQAGERLLRGRRVRTRGGRDGVPRAGEDPRRRGGRRAGPRRFRRGRAPCWSSWPSSAGPG